MGTALAWARVECVITIICAMLAGSMLVVPVSSLVAKSRDCVGIAGIDAFGVSLWNKTAPFFEKLKQPNR